MGWKNSQTEYKIKVEIDTFGEKKGTFSTVDVVHYTVMRCPLLKPIPVATITLDLDPKFVLGMVEKLNTNIFPECTVTIETGDSSGVDSTNVRQSKTKDLTNVNMYNIVELIDTENLPSSVTMFKQVKLVMVDSLSHWLGHSNGFSKTLRDVTAYEALQEYEGYLYSEFGGGDTFDPVKHIIKTTNTYKYRRIHLASKNDLVVPQLILSMYKPLINFCYYFMDTFKSSVDSRRRVSRLFVDLNNLDSFEQWDITENGHEDAALNYVISKESLVDRIDKFIRHGDYSKVLVDTHGRYRRKLPKTEVSVPYYISKDSKSFHKESHSGGRGNGGMEEFHPISTSKANKMKSPKEGEVINVLDSYAIAESRADANKNIVRNVIESFDTYNFPNAQPNSIEFHRKFNMDKYVSGVYKWIPMHITNEFTKLNPKEAKYKHSAIVKFIKYK